MGRALRVFLVSIGHKDTLIISFQVALHSFVAFGSLLIDALTSVVATDERDSLDVRMSADLNNDFEASVGDVEHTLGIPISSMRW